VFGIIWVAPETCLVPSVDVLASEIALMFAVAFALEAFPLELHLPLKQDESSTNAIPLMKRIEDPIVPSLSSDNTSFDSTSSEGCRSTEDSGGTADSGYCESDDRLSLMAC